MDYNNNDEGADGRRLPGLSAIWPCALVMPNWTCLPIWNFMHIHSETVHILLFIYPMTILAEGYRPKMDMIPVIFGYIVGLACIDKALNAVLGTNFLFLTHNENNPALILIQNLTGKFYNAGIVVLLTIFCSIILFAWSKLPNKA